MVWKRLICIVLVACCAASCCCAAAADSAYIPEDHLSVFRGYLSDLAFSDHYVTYRYGDASCMAIGQISYDGSSFIGSDVTLITVTDLAQLAHEQLTTFNLTAESALIYSSIEHFPKLTERGADYAVLLTILFVVFLLGVVIRSLLRPRYGR